MNAAKPRKALLPAFFVLASLTALVGLGVWQIERKAWKENLIATLDRRLAAVPIELPPAAEWARMTPENFEFTRVRLRIERAGGDDAPVYTSGSTLRDDVNAPGYFVFTPARLPDGAAIVVNRGYVPDRPVPALEAPQDIVGSLRWPEAPSWFVSERDSSGIWYVRDPRAMARALGWGDVAPFYVEQEAPVPPSGLPHPAALQPRLRNDHLQYALTWFGLALVLVVMSALWLKRRRGDPALERRPHPPA